MRDTTTPPGDTLRPSRDAAASAWRARVEAGRAQIERLREVEEPADFYRPMAGRFGQDPHRLEDAALRALRELTEASATWLDIGAGGGRYTLPLALHTAQVLAVEPSASMRRVLRDGMRRYGITNIELIDSSWPVTDRELHADVALMAHVGYDIPAFSSFLDAAERAAGRCIVVMRTGGGGRASHALWPEVHGEERVPYPMLPELLVLLVARGVDPQVTLVERGAWGYRDPEHLLESLRRMLWLRPGSQKDRRLEGIVRERARERDGAWDVDWQPMQDAIVSWPSTDPR